MLHSVQDTAGEPTSHNAVPEFKFLFRFSLKFLLIHTWRQASDGSSLGSLSLMWEIG